MKFGEYLWHQKDYFLISRE